MNKLQRYYWSYRLKGSPYQALFHDTVGDECISLDCETTSLNPKQAELVSIAATKICGNRILTSQSFSITLRAPHSLNADSVKIHQLRHQDLSQGVDEFTALTQLLAFIGNRPLVGYHIRYDKTILDRAFRRHFGFPLPNRLIEVSQIYHDKLEQQLPNAYIDLSLSAICHHLDLPCHERHNALQDTITAALIFVRLRYGELPPFSASKPHP
ncbi:3'-5' exonuclease [Vibrio sp. SM6]|uniref:3'-5' exonuclease n=1 Tax=Vibrio agarilyticus TaxID=2726741 RepID=A0A7X8TSG0_9VIBR|nr:3'-5' exonuclease [Vibrio agarilyticus]NLS13986.1 3'-5' exonuclease [Vibrio agarilyticus]